MSVLKVRKLRRFGTDIHVVSFIPSKSLFPTLVGVSGKRQKLSTIRHKWLEEHGYKPIAGVNFSFFDMKTGVICGLYYTDSGFLHVPPSKTDAFIEAMFTHDGRLILDDISLEEFNQKYKGKVSWGGALSYTLVINGKKDIRKSKHFPHAKYDNPRTFFGQNERTKEFFICVAEGRNSNDRGLTAEEQAEILLELGCTIGANADGGGSSELILFNPDTNKLEVVNYLGDGRERPIPNALMVYTNEDVKIEYEEEKTPLIILDAGHGGIDPGGGSNQYWKEKDLALKITLYQYKRFKELGIPVALTRSTDKTLTPEERTRIVRESGAKYCFSNHINSASSPDIDGAEIIHSIYAKPDFANTIAEGIKMVGQNIRRVFTRRSTQNHNRDYYFMHRNTGAVKTLIIEYGFATSKKDDVQQLMTKWEELAEATVKGFCKYLKLPYTPPKKNKQTPPVDTDKVLEQQLQRLSEIIKDTEKEIRGLIKDIVEEFKKG